MKKLLVIVTLWLLFISTSEYSIQGLWQLDVDQSFTELNPEAEVTFDFQKKIENGQIVNHMTVFACQIMQFTYEIDENDVYIQFKAYLGFRRECATDETREIRRKTEKVFYTVTIGQNLLFLAPDGQTIFKLVKLKEHEERKQFSGRWNAFEISGEKNNVLFTANSSNLEVCDGRGMIGYQTGKDNLVRFSILLTNGCRQFPFFTALHRAKFYRSRDREIYFYNDKYDLIIKGLFLAPYNGEKPLPSDLGELPSGSFEENNVNESEDEVIQSENQAQTPTMIQQVQVKEVQSKEVNSKILESQVGVANLETLPNSGQQIKEREKIPENSEPAPPENTENIIKIVVQEAESAEIQNINQAVLSSSFKKQQGPIDISTIKTKWFPIDTSLSQYFVIVMSNRLMLYGGCNVYYSLFQIQSSQSGEIKLKDIEIRSSENECGNEDDEMVNKFMSILYLEPFYGDQENRLNFKDENGDVLFEASNLMQI